MADVLHCGLSLTKLLLQATHILAQHMKISDNKHTQLRSSIQSSPQPPIVTSPAPPTAVDTAATDISPPPPSNNDLTASPLSASATVTPTQVPQDTPFAAEDHQQLHKKTDVDDASTATLKAQLRIQTRLEEENTILRQSLEEYEASVNMIVLKTHQQLTTLQKRLESEQRRYQSHMESQRILHDDLRQENVFLKNKIHEMAAVIRHALDMRDLEHLESEQFTIALLHENDSLRDVLGIPRIDHSHDDDDDEVPLPPPPPESLSPGHDDGGGGSLNNSSDDIRADLNSSSELES